MQSKYDTAIQGGALPDVGGVGAAMLAGIAAQGALEPLDKRIEGTREDGWSRDRRMRDALRWVLFDVLEINPTTAEGEDHAG